MVQMLALLALPALATPARAEWPERTITIIVPFAAGGPGDVAARLLATELSKHLGQNVIIENRPGAVGDIGTGAAARAKPDGYTLLATSNVLLINPYVRQVTYDPIKSFEPVAYLGAAANAIITRPDSGIANIADLIAKARANPGKLTYATTGVGSVSHLAAELLRVRAGLNMIHVPYAGAAPALQAAAAGQTDIASVSMGGVIGNIKSGMVKALVQTGSERWKDLPDVPTMGEAGIPNAVVETWQMLLAPAGTPEPIVKRLAEATRAIKQNPDIQAKMLKIGFQPGYLGPKELHERMVKELPMWKELIERAGIKQK
ncbi:MAG TPA: tripartite tricarboxylate transporter substrate binding protein [Xanthobacteraceae bacterium]|nr:tripartite tricarboxylate transporter substrate binding protein [Xanthobacteraceae bacterium]